MYCSKANNAIVYTVSYTNVFCVSAKRCVDVCISKPILSMVVNFDAHAKDHAPMRLD